MSNCYEEIMVAVAVRESEIVEEIRKMVREWEDTMGDDADKTLYTLGLRRAIDMIQGESNV